MRDLTKAAYSAVVGGYNNAAYGLYSFVGAGYANMSGDTVANDIATVVCGGYNNYVIGNYSTIGGGRENSTMHGGECEFGTIAGGNLNVVSKYGFIGGGYNNQIDDGGYNTIGGGYINIMPSCTGWTKFDFIGGGQQNRISFQWNTICGGQLNEIVCDTHNFIGGGFQNCIMGSAASVICGGEGDTIGNIYSAILGGRHNIIAGQYSSIIGGEGNKILGNANHSLAFGESVSVSNPFTVAFFTDYYDVNPGEYMGRVGINTPNPTAELEVNGTVKISQILHLKPIILPITGSPGDVACDTLDNRIKMWVEYSPGYWDWRPITFEP